jgi:hypothetical protein
VISDINPKNHLSESPVWFLQVLHTDEMGRVSCPRDDHFRNPTPHARRGQTDFLLVGTVCNPPNRDRSLK